MKKTDKISFLFAYIVNDETVLCVCVCVRVRGWEKTERERGKNPDWPFWRGEAIKQHIYCSPHIILIYIYGLVDNC